MIEMHDALARILDSTDALEKTKVPLREAYGRVLREDVYADSDIPPFHKAAMDGYALRSVDLMHTPALLEVADSIQAGDTSKTSVDEGNCVKIMTGAPVPKGADAVVMREETQIEPDGKIRFTVSCTPGQNICKAGEDVRRGELVLRSGSIIRAPEIAILAAVGKHTPAVTRAPEVALVATGNEIVEPDQALSDGMIRNSNGPMLYALMHALGCEVDYFGIVGDDEKSLLRAITAGMNKDVLLLSGGVSMGDYDFVPELVEKIGARIIFHKVRVKPGKPLLFARKGRCSIFGIPGNPVSNFTTFNLFIKPALRKLMGQADCGPEFYDGVLEEDFQNTSSRVHVVPSMHTIERGCVRVSPFMLNGSADIIGCSRSSCLAVFFEGKSLVKRGERIKIVPLTE
jgi:molybdopterin molybdotransferase